MPFQNTLGITFILASLLLNFTNCDSKSNSQINKVQKPTPKSKATSKKPKYHKSITIPHNIKKFRKAKKLMKKIYSSHQISFYGGCSYNYKRVKGKKKIVVNQTTCGYTPRKNAKRGRFIEWEHVVPAWAFGHTRKCWREGDSRCKKRGRKCCGKVDPVFNAMESDLHNLRPAIGELNADRSNYHFAMLSGEPRVYGEVDFEVNFAAKEVEPRPEIRGDIARTYFYMEKTYNVRLSDKKRQLYEVWNDKDPVDDWERERNKMISEIQGNENTFIQ